MTVVLMIEVSSTNKPLAVLIHGFGGSLDQFTTLARELVASTTSIDSRDTTSTDDSMDVLALDSLGFGRSEKPPLSYNQYLWTDQVC